MRIKAHPVIQISEKEKITFIFNNSEIVGEKGESVASALWANSIKTLRSSEKKGESRGVYCGIGNCYDCRVYLKGKGMVRACITPIYQGMELYSEDRGDMSS